MEDVEALSYRTSRTHTFPDIISAAEVIPSNIQQIGDHRGRITHGVYPRLGRIAPDDRDLTHPIPQHMREIEHLHIESESLARHALRDLDSRLSREAFEAALSIPNPAQDQSLYQDIEQTSHLLSVPGLVHFDGRLR